MKAEYDFSQGKRGTLEPTSPGKTRITIRLDDDFVMVSIAGSRSRWRQLSDIN